MAGGPQPKLSDSDFIAEFETIGPTRLSNKHGLSTKCVYQRRKSLENRLGRQITGPEHPNATRHNVAHPQRVHLEVENGTVIIGSDAHIWPGPRSTAIRAFIKFCKDIKPKAVILNGDVLDFPQVSRYPPIGWESHPTVQNEIEAGQDVLSDIERATFKIPKVWTLGNHDGRFETRLATVAPEFAKVKGIHLRDHFPAWQPGWSCWINQSVVVKHRFKGGLNAALNNTMASGLTMVTGHLHSPIVTAWTDYNGTRYGVDTGCLADPDHRAFVDYTEDNPKNWRSAFGVLTFRDGVLLPPELVTVHDAERVAWRGELIKV